MSEHQISQFKKILVANRSEIAIRIFRACTELGIQTVAIYSEEDRLSLHRYKADEAYLIGKGLSPVGAYLDIPGIVALAKEKGVDAIHPGYGFLSENADMARACAEAGITFIGPPPEVLDALGDKVSARAIAERAKVPVIPGTKKAVKNDQDALLFAKKHGFPLIIKAAHGGGGRGMTIVHNREQLLDAVARSRSEAQKAFGSPKVFIEKYLERPKHIEIQVIADRYGNMVHLFERDCSIQRRHQKVIEIAPSRSIKPGVKDKLYRDALSICAEVNYVNAGTVEFLVDQDGNHYFIEVNPRVQVEHTITEIITGRDIVQTQIRIAEGYPLEHDTIRIPSQSKVKKSGYAIQLRITSEDPANQFAPDTGKLTAFRAGEGFGIRLDSGNGFEGAVITPHYDSLLTKLCTWSLDYDLAVTKALRAIREFRIRGVKTNLPFLENMVDHERFRKGDLDTGFIDDHPELMQFKPKRNRANKLLRYLGDLRVNGAEGIQVSDIPARIETPIIPTVPKETAAVSPAYAVFAEKGAEGLSKWLLEQKQLFITDTTMRDAHQSLLATRVRGNDMFNIAHATTHLMNKAFSFEMWGGATFDVSMRFLHESPWERLRRLRRLMPGHLLQMLIRSGNAVGYTNYPDNVVHKFIQHSAAQGVDVFRIFDCLNWVESMKPSIEAVAATGKIAEAAVCYTGDISDNRRVKFNLDYYIKRAKELEACGCHILAIKDMAGLLKPRAATILVDALKNALQIPVHLHTHDTSGNGVATLLRAAEAGVDIVDAALSSMSGMTSQPSLNALVTAMDGGPRDTGLANRDLQQLADYWETARVAYAPFECGLKAGTAEVYRHEIPGGQYSNLRPQAISLGLGHRWNEIKDMYRVVNDMLGQVIKVTPSSKAVGDMALFMVQNDLTPELVIQRGKDLAFPQSFVNLMKGMMGQPDGGFPADLQKAVIKDESAITVRPGQLLEDFDFEAAAAKLEKRFGRTFSDEELVTYALYPQVFVDFVTFVNEYGDLSVLDTPTFFYGLGLDEEKAIEIEPGKTLIVKLLAFGEPHENGRRELFFELNGRARNVMVFDKSTGVTRKTKLKADPDQPNHVAAPMSGKITELKVKKGEKVKEGQKLMVTEAMKMLNLIVAPKSGVIVNLPLGAGEQVDPGDLVAEIE
ncbi:pyruvate carboxylase [Acanthopleuribacter pedis]|uniref:pyruvate carboxylase n=1 Tax=Acanthopleuribacter pedis TaxID=442870 RepID=UPI001FAFF57D|nr:pyruvate carboxylase [Acanthopleuribacter pedis]